MATASRISSSRSSSSLTSRANTLSANSRIFSTSIFVAASSKKRSVGISTSLSSPHPSRTLSKSTSVASPITSVQVTYSTRISGGASYAITSLSSHGIWNLTSTSGHTASGSHGTILATTESKTQTTTPNTNAPTPTSAHESTSQSTAITTKVITATIIPIAISSSTNAGDESSPSASTPAQKETPTSLLKGSVHAHSSGSLLHPSSDGPSRGYYGVRKSGLNAQKIYAGSEKSAATSSRDGAPCFLGGFGVALVVVGLVGLGL